MGYQLGDCDLEYPYRYSLVAHIDNQSNKPLIVIQCNPSVASNTGSDPTAGKVAIWAEEHGYGEVVFLNLFAIISSQTSVLIGKPYEDIVGPRNDSTLKEQLNRPNCTVVLAWGGDVPIQDAYYIRRLAEIRNLVESSGHTAHHVGALSYGTHPRHGRMWNKGNRDLRILEWEKIGAYQGARSNAL